MGMNTYPQITVQNIHPTYRIRKKEIVDLLQIVLKSEEMSFPVDVIFVDDDFMKRLNREFTRRRKTTDVLSFGMKEGEDGGVDYPGLGDIYISLDQAKRQAIKYNVSFKEEIRRIVIHGLLHLLGYDHKNKKQAKIMKEKEDAYLNWSAQTKAKAQNCKIV
jgi:probable rRNA maturation factor